MTVRLFDTKAFPSVSLWLEWPECSCTTVCLCSSRTGKENKKRQRLSRAVPAANHCSAQSGNIPLCWLPLLLFRHSAALSELQQIVARQLLSGASCHSESTLISKDRNDLTCAHRRKIRHKFSLSTNIFPWKHNSTWQWFVITMSSCTKVNPHPLGKQQIHLNVCTLAPTL